MEPTTQPSNPMRESHLPITEAEINPNMHNESPSSAKNTLLTLASLLVLAGIVGITLYLYIQNKSGNKSYTLNNVDKNAKEPTATPAPTLTIEQRKAKYNGIVCKKFTSIDQALSEPEIACTLDLSGQNLTEVPEEITNLSSLNTLNLSKNNLTTFPSDLTNMPNLVVIDLSDNKIAKADGIKKPKVIQNKDLTVSVHVFQSVDLRNNNINKSEETKFKSLISSKEILF